MYIYVKNVLIISTLWNDQIRFVIISFTSYGYFFMIRTLKTLFSYFKIYNKLILTMATLLFSRSPNLFLQFNWYFMFMGGQTLLFSNMKNH